MTGAHDTQGTDERPAPPAGSLRRRLLRRLAPPLLAFGVAAAFFSYQTALREADNAYNRTLLASARTIAERIDVRDGKVVVDVPYVALDTFQIDTRGRMYYQVLDPRGRFVSGSDDLPAMPAGTERSRDYPALVHFYRTTYHGVPLRMAQLWQPVADPVVGGMAIVLVGETTEMRDDMARELLLTTLWQQALLIALAMLLIVLAVGGALAPLRQLRERLDSHDPASPAPIPEAPQPREIRPLVAALNHYLARLRSVADRQLQFVDDASHQLRTALAVIKTQAEHGERAQPGVSAWRDVLAAIDRTVRLTNQLLMLARAGAQTPPPATPAPLRLDALCREVCADWYLPAREAGMDLAVESPLDAPAWIAGDSAMLREMLSNLLENALHHAAGGDRITVSVLPGPNACTLLVDDSGPGIPPAQRERVFERFVRLDAAGSAGTGLGLAIVRTVCETHQATVQLEDGDHGHGLRVRIVFPPLRARPPEG